MSITSTKDTLQMKRSSKSQEPKELGRFDGIYGERLARPDSDYLFSELLETRSSTFGWDIKPHLHPGLTQFFFVEEGAFDFFEAERKTHFVAPCVLLIPSTALHGFLFSDEVRGHVLSLEEAYFKEINQEILSLSPAGLSIMIITEFNENYNVSGFKSLLKTLDREWKLNEPGKPYMLRACLQTLFLMTYRLQVRNEPIAEETGSPALRHYRKFLALMLDRGGRASVKELAEELAISAVQLNRICKRISGKSAGQLQQQSLLAEAKKYLTYTGYSVSEIAYLLHFEYPGYFARFFRKHTGLSPKAYRSAEKA